MKLNMFLGLISALALSIPLAHATSQAETKFVAADKVIKNLNTAINDVKSKSDMTVPFPKQIPQPEQTLFASYNSFDSNPDYNKFWSINVVNSPACTMQGCIVGEITAEKNKKMETTYTLAPYDQHHKPIPKQKVTLSNQIIGFFTPGHAEANWHPATIEWTANNVLYTLTWDMKGNTKKALIEMASSAIARH